MIDYLVAIAIAFILICGIVGGWQLRYLKSGRLEQTKFALDYDRIAQLEVSLYGHRFYCDGSPWPATTETDLAKIQAAKDEIMERLSPVDRQAQEKFYASNPPWQDYTGDQHG